MNEKHFFADVDLPFHVWVRESSGARGFRWVLREATHLRQAAANEPDPGCSAGGADLAQAVAGA